MATIYSDTDTGDYNSSTGVLKIAASPDIPDSVILSVSSADAAPNSIHEFDTAVQSDTLNWTATANRDGGGTAQVVITVTGAINLSPDPGNTRPYGVYAIDYDINGGATQTYYHAFTDAGNLSSGFTFYTQDTDGWTVIPAASATDRYIYVDNSAVDDDNAGPLGNSTDHYTGASPPAGGWLAPSSVNPYKTIAAAEAQLRSGTGDRLLFKRGETWTQTSEIAIKSGMNATRRIMYMAYGTGARPIINKTSQTADNLFRGFADEHYAILNLDLQCTFKDPDHGDWVGYQGNPLAAAGISIYQGDGGAAVSNVLIEGCKISHFGEGIVTNGTSGSDNLVIRRNYIYRCWSQDDKAEAIFLTSCSVLSEDNVFEHNGWTQQSILESGTATSGTAGPPNTLTVTAAGWSSDQWVGSRLYNLTTSSSAYGNITDVTGDVITFEQDNGTIPDFTGGGDTYQIGGNNDTSQGQATIFNHNCYFTGCHNSIIRKNIYYKPGSINHKFTSNPKWTAGSHTGGTETTTLIDSDRGVGTNVFNATAVGRTVTNNTTGASGAVTSVTNDTTLEVTLTGGTRQDWQNGDTYDFDGDYSAGWSADEASENTWLEGGRQRAHDIVEYENIYLDGDIGSGYGGNDDYDVGFRWIDCRFMQSYFYKLGISAPTNRSIAHASSMDDADGGVTANNIYANFGASPQTNCIGFQIVGHQRDSQFIRNVLYNIGDATGTGLGNGALLFKTSESPDFTSFDFIENYIQMAATDARVIIDFPSSEAAGITASGNHYYSDRAAGEWAEEDGTPETIATFSTTIGETGSSTDEKTFVDATKTIETYQTSLSATATLDAFVTDAAAIRDNQAAWSTDYDASYVIQYLRRGFIE